uniref:FRIGIDA-like protein n=1 Tax=Leersia perrieri TaxID=77586 RepID=A0A0D9VW03_9ORYZ
MADTNQSPPPPAAAVAEPRVATIPDLNFPSLESVMLSSLEEAMAAMPWRAEILRRSYERAIQGAPITWDDIKSTQEDLSLGLADLHAAASEGMEGGGTAEVDEKDGADGAAKEESPDDEEEMKAVAKEEIEQDGGEVAAMEMKVENEAMPMDASLQFHADAASDLVGMDIKGKRKCHDFDEGEEVAVVDRKGKGKIADMEHLLEQVEYKPVVETMEEALEGRISCAFDEIDKVALKSAVETLRLKKRMRIPSIDWTEEEEEAAYFEEVTTDDKANEEAAIDQVTPDPDDQANEEEDAIDVPIQEDVVKEEEMESDEEEEGEFKEAKQASPQHNISKVAAGKKKVTMDFDAAKEKNTKTRSSRVEDGKVANGGESAGAKRKDRRRDPAPRRELAVACDRMDSFELAELVITAGRDIAGEFPPALRRAPHPPALALHAAAFVVSSASVPRGDVDSGSWDNLAELLRAVRDIVARRPRLARRQRGFGARPREASTDVAKRWCAIIAGEATMGREPAAAAWCRSASWALLQFVAAYGIAGNIPSSSRRHLIKGFGGGVVGEEKGGYRGGEGGGVPQLRMITGTAATRWWAHNHGIVLATGEKKGGGPVVAAGELEFGVDWRNEPWWQLINRLLQNAKHIDAVKVARAFSLVDRFPPVAIIKAYVEKVKEAAQDMDRAMEEDIDALRSAKEAIEVHDRGSNYRYSIMQEVHKLMGDYEKKKRSLSIGSNSNSRRRSNERQ